MMIKTLRQRNFALLWLGGMISQTGDWLLIIGLPVYVYAQTGSALATSFTLISGFIPGILFGSIAGIFADRWNRKWTLIISNLLLAISLLPLLLVHSKSTLWIVYIVLFFSSLVEQIVSPAENALLPSLVSEETLVSANSLISVSSNASRLIGAALGGIVLGLLGLSGAVLLDILSFLLVSVLIIFINVPSLSGGLSFVGTRFSASSGVGRLDSKATKAEPSQNEQRSATARASWKRFVEEWLEGLRLIYRQRTLAILLIAFALTGIGEGIFGVLLVVFVKQVLGGDAVVYGSLLAVQAIGSLAGGLAISQLGNRLPPLRLAGVGLFCFGVVDLLIVDLPLVVHGLLIVFLLFILVGLPGTAGLVGLNTSLQLLVEDNLRGRIFASFLASRTALMLVGMVLAGTLGDRLGSVLMLNAQGGMYVISGLLVLFTLWRVVAGKQAKAELLASQ
ncbi:MAG TPA: MFS transporter [Ktedonobacteraceae bacterium]|nr:MFS transporter [Ktedonobacteraceae bacterium]